MFDIASEAQAIRTERHRAQVKRNHDAATLTAAASVMFWTYGLRDESVALEAIADRIVSGELART